MFGGAQRKSKKDGIQQFLKTFPWWYSLVKWLVPITVGAFSALLIGAVTTGLLGLPAFLSGLGALPVLYANISAFGAFALLGISMITVATILGGAAGFITRIGLFPLVETMADDNYKAVEIFQTLTQDELRKQVSKLRSDYDNALLDLNTENKQLKKQIRALEHPSSAAPVLLSNAAKSTVVTSHVPEQVKLDSSSSNDDILSAPEETSRKPLKRS